MILEFLQTSSCYPRFKEMNDKIPARLVLYFLLWSENAVSFMMRNDMNIALVAMVNDTNVNVVDKKHSIWSPSVQSVIRGSLFWCFVLCQPLAGVTVHYLSSKLVFGCAQLTHATCSFFIPLLAHFHYGYVIALRSLQGLASGMTWPAMYAMIGAWIPSVERSRFMSCLQGLNVGLGMTYLISGFIIKRFGWIYVFITSGSLGMICCVMWYFFAFSTPQQHPRISAKELQYIENNVDYAKIIGDSKNVPYNAILTSLPVWCIAITTFGRIWVQYIFIFYGPIYMKDIFKFEYEENGIMVGVPHFCSYFSALFFCYIADKFVKRFSITYVRKIFTAISQVVPAALLLAIGYLGYNVWVMGLWFTAVMLITAAYAGAMANIVDLSPNFAGQVLAFSEMIHMSAAFVVPFVESSIVINTSEIVEWRLLFAISSVIAGATFVIYAIWGTAKVQSWNIRNPR